MSQARKRQSSIETISRTNFVFVFLLFATGLLLIAWASIRTFSPRPPASNLAFDAKAYLRSRNIVPLSEPLERLLASPSEFQLGTQPHPLLGCPSPSFELTDHLDKSHRLSDLTKSGPVVVVFYYGYWCNHCVSQLFALNDDAAKFKELGATIVAISADPPEQTRERFAEFGEFKFLVLSDRDNKVAQEFCVFEPAHEREPERLMHGTFLVDRMGCVRWCQFGDEPFTNNRALLIELAKLENRLQPELK